MVVDGNTVRPAENVNEIFDLVPRIKEIADMSLEILSNVDSTNVLPSDWECIIDFIVKNRDEYDGFLVAHGTNTMAYTASALALGLGQDFGKPVVITGSQLPLTVYGNDGQFNLENSVKTLSEAINLGISEVMIVFNDYILRGSRSVKVSESAFRAFDSPAFEHLGKITSTGIHFSPTLVHTADPTTQPSVQNRFQTGVITIDLSPGQEPLILSQLLSISNIKGIVLKSHGAGSVPTIGSFSFLPFIAEATAKGVPVLVTTKFMGGNSFKETNDEPALQAIDAGAIPTGDLTDVMVEVKLMWLLGQGITDLNEIRARIIHPENGEITS